MRVHVLQCVKLLSVPSQILKNERGGERRKMCVVNGRLEDILYTCWLASSHSSMKLRQCFSIVSHKGLH